jgi:hypothetical protein
MKLLDLHLLRLSYRTWRVHAYLAELRGDKVEAAACEIEASRVQMEIDLMELQRRYGCA